MLTLLMLLPLAQPATAHPAFAQPAAKPVPAHLVRQSGDEGLRETPVVELVDRDGQIERKELSDLGDDIQLGDTVLLRWEGLVAPVPMEPASARASLVLVSGDRLYGHVVGGEVDDLIVRLVGEVETRLAIDDLERIVFESRIPSAWTAPVEAADEGDRLYRVQGTALDRLDGTVEELTEEGVRFHGVLGSRVLPWNEVAALFVESLGPLEPETDETAGDLPAVVVDLIDGGRLRGELRSLDDQECVLGTRRGELRLPLAILGSLALDDGSVAFLSDLAPKETTDGAPFGDDLGMRWPHRFDRSVTGKPLRAAGRAFSRGIGVHAPSRMVWELDGGWTRLLGSVAVDDEVLLLSSRGSVVFRVLVDGQPLWESPILHGGDTPLELPELELSGAKELVLEVDASTDFFVADRADWLTMMLVR